MSAFALYRTELNAALVDPSNPLSQFTYSQLVLIIAVTQFIFLVTLRCMDDVKDYDKDCIVHKDRPLPRGLLKKSELENFIRFLILLLFGFAAGLGHLFSFYVGATFAFQTFYLVLMYIEFGVGHWLEPYVFLYAITHQISIYFGAFHIVTFIDPNLMFTPKTLLLGTVALSGFFTFEVCRKLDPTLPIEKGTYLIVYGRLKTYLFTLLTMSLGVYASYELGIAYLLWPLHAVLLVSLTLLFTVPQKKSKHKIVEAFSILFVLIHIWSAYIHEKISA